MAAQEEHDVFFKSLALDFGDRSIGVILSGTGSDGSRGVRRFMTPVDW